MNIYNYKEIINRQKDIKTRISSQSDNIKWSGSYINLSDYFPFFKKSSSGEISFQENIVIEIQHFIFRQEIIDNIINIIWLRENEEIPLFKIFILAKENSETKKIIYDIKQVDFKLYNLPFHFGIKTYTNKDIYRINQNSVSSEGKTLAGTIFYKNNFKYNDLNNDLNIDDYIIFNKFALKNYLETIEGDKLILKYNKRMEDYIITTNFNRQLFIEVISNPCYDYQNTVKVEKGVFKVPFLSIKNNLYKWNRKTVLYYMKNMPQQEYILDDQGKEYIMDFNKEINQYNNVTDKIEAINEQNIKKDEIIYNFNQEYNQDSLKMRII